MDVPIPSSPEPSVPRVPRSPLRIGLLAILMLCLCADAARAGSVRLVRGADAVTLAPTPAEQAWMGGRFWRWRGAAPSWALDAWVSQHAFGLDAADAAAHPDWILHDSTGAALSVGSRAAADFGNASFRSWWIARAQAAVAAGYRGLYVDDVFMERRVTSSAGATRTPIDPRTGTSMTEANWQKYMADFMVSVRAALPGSVEIVHDVLWYKGDAKANVLRELQAATYVALESGFNDPAIVSGTSTYGWQTLAGWVEREQARGGAVVFDGETSNPAAQLYALASYLLVGSGASSLENDLATAPGAGYWTGYDVDLGAASGARYSTGGVWRRDFARGIVLVNEPYRATRTVSVPAGYVDLDGVACTSVTLAGGAGMVLVPAPVVPTPTPTPTSTAPPVTVPPVATPAPVATPVSVPVGTATPSGSSAAVARISTAAKDHRKPTRTTVHGKRALIYGKVTGAGGGRVRFAVDRQRGPRWPTVRRASAVVKRTGRFSVHIRAVPHGSTYRVRISFLGTRTARPSTGYGTFHA
jgi:hypothetical protein